jgi:hypothetical protein
MQVHAKNLGRSMLGFLPRMLGVIFLGAAFALFVYDATRSIAGGFQLYVRGNLWEPLAVTVLDAPAFLVLGSLGAMSILLGTKKNRPIAILPTGRWFRALSRGQPLAGRRDNMV